LGANFVKKTQVLQALFLAFSFLLGAGTWILALTSPINTDRNQNEPTAFTQFTHWLFAIYPQRFPQR
jgi:hypothetical protein